jgi:hypothetical protein
LYVYGLCPSCNNLQSRFDAAYGELAAAVRPLWMRDARIRTAGKLPLPGDEIRPGAVARSMLIGFLGLSPHLRVNFTELALQLLAGAPAVTLPTKLRLRWRCTRGRACGAHESLAYYAARDSMDIEGQITLVEVEHRVLLGRHTEVTRGGPLQPGPRPQPHRTPTGRRRPAPSRSC